jgi:hypothetical protein
MDGKRISPLLLQSFSSATFPQKQTAIGGGSETNHAGSA